MSAPMPADEDARLAALHSYGLPDDPRTPVFDRIAALAGALCAAPMSAVGVLDADQQRFLGQSGVPLPSVPRGVSFGAHAVADGRVLVVPDAAADPRFRTNPHVTGDPGIRFYAGVPLIDEDGHALGTLCVLDRTPRELTAEQTAALTLLAELAVGQLTARRARRAVTDLERRLDCARAREGEFLAGIAHEVRTPITVIQGYLELLGDGTDPAQLGPVIERVRRNGERLVRLVDDLGAAAARRGAAAGPATSLVDVAAVVTAVAERRRCAASAAGVAVTVTTDGAALARASDGDVARVAGNLIDNAIAFTRSGGGVTVRVTSRSGATIEVVDTGVGIPEPEQRHLFERFFRGAYAREQAIDGLGLGLSVVRSIMDAHGGRVTVESAPARGTRVVATFPPPPR